MKFNFKHIALIAVTGFSIILFNSCGDDEITGCTDPMAENFNPDATISGDCEFIGCTDPLAENFNPEATISGDCVFARDKFLGTYMGSLTCPGQLTSLTNDSISFSIIEGLEPDIPSDIILEIMVDGIQLPIAGQVDGDVLNLMQNLRNVSVPTPIGNVMGDVDAVGTAMVSADQMTLNGNLSLEVAVAGGVVNLNDNCTILGMKQ